MGGEERRLRRVRSRPAGGVPGPLQPSEDGGRAMRPRQFEKATNLPEWTRDGVLAPGARPHKAASVLRSLLVVQWNGVHWLSQFSGLSPIQGAEICQHAFAFALAANGCFA